MAVTLQIKRSTGTTAPSSLADGELAYTHGTGTQGNNGDRLFIGDGSSINVIGGQYFSDMLDHVAGTLTASSAVVVDSNKAVDELLIGNNSSTGGTLKLNEGTSNGTHFVGLKAGNSLAANVTFTLPTADGSSGQFIQTNGSGALTFADGSVAADDITAGDAAVTLTTTAGNITVDAQGNDTDIIFKGTDGTVDTTFLTIDGSDAGTLIANHDLELGTDGSIIKFGADNEITLTHVADTGLLLEDSGGTPTLQLHDANESVSSDGTNLLLTSGGTAFTFPNSDGTNGQILTTNGSGTLSFASAAASSFTLAADSGSNDTFNTGETLTFTGGEGIDTTVSDNTITIAGEDASTSNKGIASFATADFAVSSGAVTIKALGVSNAQLAGSIANAKLVNDGITIGSDDTSLGDTITDLNGLTSVDVDNITIDGNTISTTNANGNLTLDPNGSGTVDVNSSRITSVTDPSSAQDAATKAYVDSVANGLDVKGSVKAATTGALPNSPTYDNGTSGVGATLTAGSNGALTLDGVTLSASDRILVKNQSTGAQNGIYTVTTVGDGSTAYVITRATDADTATELTGGSFVFVEQGTANADNGYVFTHNGSPTVGTTDLTVEQFSGAGQISAGDGLAKSGNTLSVNVDDSSIEINSDTLRVKASGITNAMLAGSIDLTAKVTGSLPVANGGTGLTAAAKGSVIIANAANTISALDGGGSNDGILLYTSSSDTISWSTSVDGGTF